MRVTHVESKQQWDELLEAKSSIPIVVDFTATWCGPCRMIGPEFDRYSEEYPEAIFLKVDVDQLESVAAECGISAMPTFQVWLGKRKVAELIGASKDRLKELLAVHASSASRQDYHEPQLQPAMA